MKTEKAAASRLPFIDAIKAIASQLIVLHHLAFYGPMSDYAREISPELFSWLSLHARIAVQAFLVIGGFLTAQSLTRNGQLTNKPISHLLWKRYLKLVAPYVAALLLAVAATALSRQLMTHPSISEAPSPAQFIAHILLLQSILGFDGLSAGAWYVAIDFQLYALLLIVLWLTSHARPNTPTVGWWCVLLLIAASLFHFNRDADWDEWAFYFIGAYGLGAATYWCTRHPQGKLWMAAIVATTVAALWLDYRSRILLALLVACGLAIAHHADFMERWPRLKLLDWLGKISYSVFLTHFSVCLVINAVFERFAPHTPAIQFAGIGIAWGASIAFGAIFYHTIESPAQKHLGRRSSP